MSDRAPFRIGSVPYLNAVPLTQGLEQEIVFVPPSALAQKLKCGELDAALVSIIAVLLNDGYDVLDGVSIASRGEVKSVLLGHRRPIREAQEIYCDTASLTSVQLLRVLLAEQGLKPSFCPLPSDGTPEEWPDFVMLIGDAALDFLHGSRQHQIWDLGAAWFQLTGLPFVYAVWALSRDRDNRPLRHLLTAAKDFGLDTLDQIIRSRSEFTYGFLKEYLGGNIRYELGSDEKRGVAKFVELLRKHDLGPVFEPRYVS